ncbi:glycoside hydrolase family 20 protein [Dysgonomonas sp. OttesenSCG-928-M03]|nr:glycoside hydrolase family 20 protein [Dysgonomonas sp. OttesenSCG-928-M03]
MLGCANKAVVEADYSVIPLPQTIMKSEGAPFTLTGSTKIVYEKDNSTQKQTAEFLAEYIKLNTGLDLKVTDEVVAENVIILQSGNNGEKAESYNLTVNDKQIVINGSDDAGIFYGVQTLRKSIPAFSEKNTVTFSPVQITDYPRFAYRGSHLDVGRHFFSVEFIKKYIDLLALHNINRFHWHLTEDQGWRIEIKKYPELTKIGSQRAQTVIGRNTGEFDGKPYGGFYTQDEIKDIVAYAQKQFITIIPEIDLPGHMLAALTTYPNLGCTGGPYKVAEQWGVFDDVLCAGNDSIYTFLDDVFAEVIELFPSEYIHVGGDESPKARWKECPKCQARIKELGLKSDAEHSKEDRLQSYVISRVEKFLNSKGRQIIGWDEILEGGLAPNATVMSWRGIEGGIAAAKQHHNAIMTPTSYLYFDYYQTEDVDNEPFLGIGGYVPVEKVYNYEPVPAELTDDEKKYIIGVQANLWTEYITEPKFVEYMLLPRMGALSEIQWTMPEKKNYEAFLPRLGKLMNLYKELGYNYATHIYDIAAKVTNDTQKNIITITLSTYDNAPVYYTLDGSDPTDSSNKYSQPIEIKETTNLKAIAIRGNEKSRLYSASFKFNKATLKNVMLEHQPHRAYTFDGAITLVDGKRGRDSYGNGEWLGFSTTDFIATVDMKESTDISKVIIGTYLNAASWIFGATEYTVSISDDNKTFKQVFNEKYPVLDEKSPGGATLDLLAEFPAEKARYVKIVAKRTNPIPAWHDGKGHPAFIFVDEIIIE